MEELAKDDTVERQEGQPRDAWHEKLEKAYVAAICAAYRGETPKGHVIERSTENKRRKLRPTPMHKPGDPVLEARMYLTRIEEKAYALPSGREVEERIYWFRLNEWPQEVVAWQQETHPINKIVTPAHQG